MCLLVCAYYFESIITYSAFNLKKKQKRYCKIHLKIDLLLIS